jgi:hypothetical protein
MANGADKKLTDDLVAIIDKKLLAHQQDVANFRRKILTLWMPGVGLEFLNDAFDRAKKITALIENRSQYNHTASESAFEKIYADSLTAWYWSKKPKKKENEPAELNPDVTEAVLSMVQFFVSGLGDEKQA